MSKFLVPCNLEAAPRQQFHQTSNNLGLWDAWKCLRRTVPLMQMTAVGSRVKTGVERIFVNPNAYEGLSEGGTRFTEQTVITSQD